MNINPSGTDDVYGRLSDRGHMTCSDASVPVFCARFLPPPPGAEGKASEGGRPRAWGLGPPRAEGTRVACSGLGARGRTPVASV